MAQEIRDVAILDARHFVEWRAYVAVLSLCVEGEVKVQGMRRADIEAQT